MQQPGSDPLIPETAEITFENKWSLKSPGETQKIAFLKLTSGSELVIFNHRTWDPPVDTPIKCALYPVNNAAIAAPVGGIPDEEKVDWPAPQYEIDRLPVDIKKLIAQELIPIARNITLLVDKIYPEALDDAESEEVRSTPDKKLPVQGPSN